MKPEFLYRKMHVYCTIIIRYMVTPYNVIRYNPTVESELNVLLSSELFPIRQREEKPTHLTPAQTLPHSLTTSYLY